LHHGEVTLYADVIAIIAIIAASRKPTLFFRYL
jgi:hypothetical protein